ncbi:hypothetical protein Dsin_008831 [Dipteronia sinensis]|uniref:Uncharacterized protein n=1 Tax=Dipteronia sinensis TaxID=43782 RepID=A0AAE0APF6_9ROSI|nr:hypothetical protein Dsin_008831 [Dipteronia sinensis]
MSFDYVLSLSPGSVLYALKGLMDLGFVFTEESNKDSRLVEIVHGLQRLMGKDQISDHINDDHESANNISRPYLSEAWDVLDLKKAEKNLHC